MQQRRIQIRGQVPELFGEGAHELNAGLSDTACYHQTFELTGFPGQVALTGINAVTIVSPIFRDTNHVLMQLTELDALERKVNELIELCQVLSRENRALRSRQNTWSTERAKLIEKNELAKGKVESMISRLKSLEQD